MPPVIVRPPIRTPRFPRAPLPRTNPPKSPFPRPQPPWLPRPNDTDQEDCSTVCVWAITPTKTPKKIRYQYPGESVIEVEGESYTIENIPGRTIATYNPTATVVVSGPLYEWQDNFTRLVRVGTYNFGVNLILSPFYVPGGHLPFTGEYLDWEWTNPITNIYNSSGINIIYRDSNNIVRKQRLYPNNSSNNYPNFDVETRTLAQLNLNPSNPQQITPDQCRFRVFNATGQTIVDITRNVCPIVSEIPAICNYSQKDKKLLYTLKRRGLKLNSPTLKVEVQSNCILVKLKFRLLDVPVPFEPIVAKECSPIGCPPPKYEIECDCDPCKNRECPPSTHKRVLIGGKILQCVDIYGCVISEKQYDPFCDKFDCRC